MNRYQEVIGGAGDLLVGGDYEAKDNLYLSVNGEWLKTAKIPNDRPTTGGFSDLDQNIEKQLINDFKDFTDGKLKTSVPLMEKAIKLFKLANNFGQRDQDGVKPAMADYLFLKDQINSLADVKFNIERLIEQGSFALGLSVSPDMKDTKHNLLYVYAPSLILPDKQYYGTPNEAPLFNIYKEMSKKILLAFGESADDAEVIIQNTIDFDHLLVPLVKSSEEKADYTAFYNPVPFKEFSDQVADFGLGEVITTLGGVTPEKVSIGEPRYFKNFSEVLNEKTFPKFKDWILLNCALSSTPYLSDQIRIIGGEFGRAVSGTKEASNKTKSAYRITNSLFSEIIGIYYGDKYFGDEARSDVETKVRQMIDVYKKRLRANDWLSKPTIEKAIVKLDAIELKIGYPRKAQKIYEQLVVNDNESLYENIKQLSLTFIRDNFKDLSRLVDRTRWAMSGNLVNACYDPQVNDITFPAAILQAPFYLLTQSSAQNFGGIGAVIAHEVSHAFDNNGAKFDEEGNLNNWWTKEDYVEFEKRCQAMIKEFDGIEYGDGKVNGKLVVSENVADQGGLSCALEATKSSSDANLTEFFENWGRVWQLKASKAMITMLLASDVHAPGPLRANVQAQNMDDFYRTFNVTENDGMWLAKEDRVIIW